MAEHDHQPGSPAGATSLLERDDLRLDKGWDAILFNDPISLYGYVVDTLVKIGLTLEEAAVKTQEAHDLGKTVVFHGTKDEAEAKVILLHSAHLHAEAVAS